jgi:4-carboxymuconolactone decarboxylase
MTMGTTDGILNGEAVEGASRRARAQGARADQLQAKLASLDPGLAEMADEFIFGRIWGRPGLDQDDRMLVAITALAATGKEAQLRNYLWGAIQAGISARRIHEALVMMVVYAGFPTGVSALDCWKGVVDSAARQGLELDL